MYRMYTNARMQTRTHIIGNACVHTFTKCMLAQSNRRKRNVHTHTNTHERITHETLNHDALTWMCL